MNVPLRQRTSRAIRLARQKGQALIEYAFLMILVATILIGVAALAGNQVKATVNKVQHCIEQVGNYEGQVSNGCSN